MVGLHTYCFLYSYDKTNYLENMIDYFNNSPLLFHAGAVLLMAYGFSNSNFLNHLIILQACKMIISVVNMLIILLVHLSKLNLNK